MSQHPKHQLIINYVPGEECRVAVVKNGRLDEFHSERSDAMSHVGNIYVGKVTNIEPSIQAAFVDFGLAQSGFLHTSDLHPRYFAQSEDEAVERVGKKTPRRERPPIQECLRRGQEILVQVLKEGVGSKGPTLTSYLSIPGRYLVMMPQMDRVGVSRKVEDEEQRAKMKAILDALDLPEGFGFILRTAGFDKTKTELKRDLAYLLRLQKDMERRRKGGNRPRLLYSESDLLLRALRDMVTTDTDSIVIDSAIGLQRAARFMKIVSPRSATKLVHFTGRTPIFHAMGIEEQIRTMYSREVPLPSGGRLVIDETEALVAIDVNSGKSRSAGDSEDNAYRTNLEAIEEIARQLRLRDTGGIVVNDLIDMRHMRHRREIEAKFAEIMKTDRARSTLAPISEFGVLEMTRQRMRGSHESIHFHACPTCHGRGLIQKPDSVAADALREAAAILDHDSVARAEMVVHPRIAGELLATKRKALARLERVMGKPLSVRLSDAIGMDRITFYAYDAHGADIEIDRLPRKRANDQTLVPYVDPEPAGDADWAEEVLEAEPVEVETEVDPLAEQHPMELPLAEVDASGPNFMQGEEIPGRRGRRRRGGRGRGDRGDGRDNRGGDRGRQDHARGHGQGGQGHGGHGGHQGQQRGGPQPRPAFAGGSPPGPHATEPGTNQSGAHEQPPQGQEHGGHGPDAAAFTGVPTNPPTAEGGTGGAQGPGFGPEGQPGEMPGEGGGRRRRRRRGGRGRGRGRGQGEMAGGPNGPGEPGGPPIGQWGGDQQGFEGQPDSRFNEQPHGQQGDFNQPAQSGPEAPRANTSGEFAGMVDEPPARAPYHPRNAETLGEPSDESLTNDPGATPREPERGQRREPAQTEAGEHGETETRAEQNAPDGANGEPGEGREGGRRRRRRGGRGRGRGNGGGANGGGGNASGQSGPAGEARVNEARPSGPPREQQPPSNQSRQGQGGQGQGGRGNQPRSGGRSEGPRGDGRGNNRGGRGDNRGQGGQPAQQRPSAPPPPPPATPAPPPAAAPATPAKTGPRRLYAFNRRLKPGERPPSRQE